MSRPQRFGLVCSAVASLVLAGTPIFAQEPQPGAPPAPPPAGAPVAPAPPAPVLLDDAAPSEGPAPLIARVLHTGSLAAGDLQLESGEYYDEYTIQGGAGEEIIAVLSALDFDPYLILIPPSGEQRDNDDFGGSPDVALIEVPVESPGQHVLRITSFRPGETGEYALMAGTRTADGNDAGDDDFDFEPETFDVKGTVQFGTPISGTLGGDDPVRQDGSYYEAFTFQGQEGAHVIITLASSDFDAYLTLVSPSGATEDNDDKESGNTDSRIDTVLSESGEWIVVANTLAEGETGNYRLTVSRQ